MRKIFLYFLWTSFVIVLLMSCSSKHTKGPVKQGPEKIDSLSGYKKPASGFKDTLFISTRSAVFFDADSMQKTRIKAMMPSMYYETDVHDCFFQSRNARKEIAQNWPGVKIIDAHQIRFLFFNGNGASHYFIDLDKQNQMCGLFLFDPSKQPLFTDMMNIDTELGFYFKN